MKIGINASFARKPDSGTGQVTLNFIRKLNEIKKLGKDLKGIEFILYLEEDLDLQLAKGITKKTFLPLYKRDDLARKIWWERFLLPKQSKKDGCVLLLSLYQSATITKGIKHIMFVHDTVWKIFPKYLDNVRKRAYYRMVDKAIKKADQIATNSANSKLDIYKYFKVADERITIHPLDCDVSFKKRYSTERIARVLKKYHLPKDYIFYLGGFDVRKNLRNLVESYALMWKKHHDAMPIPDLVLGGQFHKHLIGLVTDVPAAVRHVGEKYGLSKDKIKMTGFVEQNDLPMLYQGARVFCYPSLHEGFGLPVLEAMNSGCPIVASNASSIPEVAGKNEALLVDARTAENIAEAMHTILTDEQLRERKVAKATKRARQFSWEKFTRSIIELF